MGRIIPIALSSCLLRALVLSVMLGSGCNSDETWKEKARQQAARLDEEEATLRTHAIVLHSAVSAPVGKLLLLRRGEAVCAVRFHKLRRGNDAHAPSIFSSGEESLFAEYEFSFQQEASHGFTDAAVKHGLGAVSDSAVVGLGRALAIKLSDRTLRCGALETDWGYPSFAIFFKARIGVTPGDYGLELAPTNWDRPERIDLSDPRLSWYRYDSRRRELLIPAEFLPQ